MNLGVCFVYVCAFYICFAWFCYWIKVLFFVCFEYPGSRVLLQQTEVGKRPGFLQFYLAMMWHLFFVMEIPFVFFLGFGSFVTLLLQFSPNQF